MKPRFLPFLFFILFVPASANAAGSMLRVTCDGDDIGAEVTINGKFRGECPVDLKVPAGRLNIRVQKSVDAEHERVFEQDIRMAEDSVKKIEVKLISKDLFLTQKKAEAGDIHSMQILQIIYMRNQAAGRGDPAQNAEQYFKWTRKRAEAGDASSMVDLGEAYEKGNGVEINMVEANRWYSQGLAISHKKAEGGDADAMKHLGVYYALGRGVPIDREKSIKWLHQAKDRGDPSAEEFLKSLWKQ